jgi:hypothetical protein
MQTLTLVERERITDSVLKIQSVRTSLDLVGDDKIPALHEIESCLKNADHSLRVVLGYASSATPVEKDVDKP